MTWFLMRGTGMIALLMLTGAMVLGMLAGRSSGPNPRLPRFVVQGLHRSMALTAVALLVVHVVSAVLDEYVDIRWYDALLPIGARYEPLYLGLGTLAIDLMIAIVATSLLRARLGVSGWRAVHFTGYVAWAVAVAHGLGLGSDTGSGWGLGITLGCVLAVALAGGARLIGARTVPA